MVRVDLNSDLGESFGSYSIGNDREIIQRVTSVNVACGYHGGDPLVMEATLKAAKAAGTSVGAHPGYPDLMGFGRRNLVITPAEMRAYVIYQLGALQGFAKAVGVPLRHVKPHGAMYNMAAKDYSLAVAIAEGIALVDDSLIFMALSGSEMIRAAKEVGIQSASEVFADRGYTDAGTLVPRSQEGAFIHDPQVAVERLVRMIQQGTVLSNTGKEIPIVADSICVHGDNEKALQFVEAIRTGLTQEGITIAHL